MRSVQSTLFALLAASGAASADNRFNLTQGVSPLSHDVYDLHMTVFWICVAIGIVVFSAMFYAMIFHRKSKGAQPAQFHSHPVLEIGWTIVPVIILIFLAIPATKVLFNINNNDQEALTVKITGYQWKWHYEYIEDGVSFFSNLSTPADQMKNLAPKGENYLREVDNVLVLPIHKKVRLLITSNDVNHAWWVPEFGVKKDAIAGFINEAWTMINKPGTYRGQCAELCGINHAFMPIVVVATTEQGFKDFIAKQKGQASAGDALTNKQWTMNELMSEGEKVYGKICAACHQPTGLGLPPTFPALKGSKVATGSMEKHVDTVLNGVSGTAMQAFKSQLSESEIAAVVTYERNAFGNSTGTSIQPIQIKALKEGKSFSDAMKVQPSAQLAGQTPSAMPAEPSPAVAIADKAKTDATAKTDGASQPVDATASGTPTPTPAAVAPAAASAPSQAAATKESASAPASTADAIKAAMDRGEKVYLSRCAMCHQPTGAGMPPTFPALKGSPIATGAVEKHLNIVLNGKEMTAMQPFKDQLPDQDIADVITYERNAFGNNTGSLVTPDDVKAARQQGQTK